MPHAYCLDFLADPASNFEAYISIVSFINDIPKIEFNLDFFLPKPPGPRSSMASQTLRQTILDEETATWNALSSSGPAILPLLSPKCVMLFPRGSVLSASSTPSLKEVLEAASFTPWASFRMWDEHVVALGEGPDGTAAAAVIYYHVEAEREGRVTRAVCASTWERTFEAGMEVGWKMVTHQQTLA